MPPRATRSSARRGAGGAAAAKGGKQQQHISFGQQSRVTKPSARSTSGSEKKKLEEKAAAIERADIAIKDEEKASKPIKTEEQSDEEVKREIKDEGDSDAPVRTSGIQGVGPNAGDFGTASALAIRQQAAEERAEPRSAEEETAAKLPEAQIRRYWDAKEKARMTKRVHQAGLSLHEKVLREFDMSSQFGNCIGIARTRRWKLAHKLGLQPPIEVLAVLMKEGAKDKNAAGGAEAKVQRAYVDELMTSRFLVS